MNRTGSRGERAAAGTSRRGVALGVAAAAALAVVAVLVGVSQLGADAGGEPDPALFLGVPQQGVALGNPDAPVTLVEFVDLQCPFCADYSEQVLPTLVHDYVRSGQLRIEQRTLRFIGPDSERAAAFASTAAAQDRMWQFIEAFFADQGSENSGYADDEFLRRIADVAGGLDADRLFAEVGAPATERRLAAAERLAEAAAIRSTPSFLLGPTGGGLEQLEIGALEPSAFTEPIEAAIAAAG